MDVGHRAHLLGTFTIPLQDAAAGTFREPGPSEPRDTASSKRFATQRATFRAPAPAALTHCIGTRLHYAAQMPTSFQLTNRYRLKPVYYGKLRGNLKS